jgi:hypothetical protein
VLIQKENMLAHLSNVPDIVWRSMDKKVVDANSPTHFVDLEYLMDKVNAESIPLALIDAEKAATQRGRNLMEEVGTAPWRAQQFWQMMRDAFAGVQSPGKSSKKDLEDKVNEALLAAGLMSHFVGDLSQPLHTTADYDGWDIKQGGLHAYFESIVVDQLDLQLDDLVFAAALREKPVEEMQTVAARWSKQKQPNSLKFVWAMVLGSYQKLPDLFKIDGEKIIQVKSSTDPLKVPAKRISPDAAVPLFRDLIIQRLAVSAHLLAELWISAWKSGGSPSLASYQSYVYLVAPAFVPVSYSR